MMDSTQHNGPSSRPDEGARISSWGLPIIDFHCHLDVPDEQPSHWETTYEARHGAAKLAALKANWRWYQEQWWSTYSFPFPEEPSAPVDIQVRRWADEIENARLQTIVFLTGGSNDSLAQAIHDQPRMLGFAHHDPFSEDAADELRRAVVTLGLRGYKILAPALRGPIGHPDLDPVWEAADELQIPVLIHFGVLDGGGGVADHVNISPLRLHDVAKGYPEIPFVIPHFGCGYPGDLLQLAWACRNVYVDSSGNNEWVRWMPYPLDLRDLFRKFLETLGPDRIIFGSDSAHFPRGLVRAYYDEQTRILRELNVSTEDRRKIFGGNSARLLRLDPAEQL